MNSLWRTIQRWFKPPNPPAQPAQRVRLQRRYVPSPSTMRRPRGVIVQRDTRPYSEQRGWRQNGRTYKGNYQTAFGSWRGKVAVSPSGRVEVYIKDPPQALARHPHWPCFQRRNNGWFFVHPVRPVADVSAGILNLEKTIKEAYAL